MAKFIKFGETIINIDYITCIEKCYSIGDDEPYVIRISIEGNMYMYYQNFEIEENEMKNLINCLN